MSGPSTEHQRATRATEDWFLRHGLPFFVEGRKISVDDLAHGRSVVVLGLVYFGSLVIAVPADRAWPQRLLLAAALVPLHDRALDAVRSAEGRGRTGDVTLGQTLPDVRR